MRPLAWVPCPLSLLFCLNDDESSATRHVASGRERVGDGAGRRDGRGSAVSGVGRVGNAAARVDGNVGMATHLPFSSWTQLLANKIETTPPSVLFYLSAEVGNEQVCNE